MSVGFSGLWFCLSLPFLLNFYLVVPSIIESRGIECSKYYCWNVYFSLHLLVGFLYFDSLLPVVFHRVQVIFLVKCLSIFLLNILNNIFQLLELPPSGACYSYLLVQFLASVWIISEIDLSQLAPGTLSLWCCSSGFAA